MPGICWAKLWTQCLATCANENRLQDVLYQQSHPFVRDVRDTLHGENRCPHSRSMSIFTYSLSCSESPIPGVDVDRVMFLDGEMHVAGDSSRLDAEIAALNTYYGAKAGHLPSSQVQLGQQIDWIAGPKIVVRSPS